MLKRPGDSPYLPYGVQELKEYRGKLLPVRIGSNHAPIAEPMPEREPLLSRNGQKEDEGWRALMHQLSEQCACMNVAHRPCALNRYVYTFSMRIMNPRRVR
jgi:hypothetical protein